MNISFRNAKKGLYYVILYIKDNVDSIPYVPRGSVSMNTKGTYPVTGIVIEVK